VRPDISPGTFFEKVGGQEGWQLGSRRVSQTGQALHPESWWDLPVSPLSLICASGFPVWNAGNFIEPYFMGNRIEERSEKYCEKIIILYIISSCAIRDSRIEYDL
jgi:hypothetical protein